MNRIWLACGVAALTSAATAQAPTYSPHPVYQTSEGGSSCSSLGVWTAGRHQICDGNQRSATASLLKQIAFRHDHRAYTMDDGMGRTWSSVTLDLSDGDLPSFGITYGNNPTSLPTRVFQGPLSWPLQLGPTALVPDAWSVPVPFAVSYGYAGSRDLLLDFRFSGGALANSAEWSGTRAVPYALDWYDVGTFTTGQAVAFGNVNGGCRDSKAASPIGASVSFRTLTFGPTYPTPSLRNQYYVEASGERFPPNSLVLLLLGFAAHASGLPVSPCNSLHLDWGRTILFTQLMTDAAGAIPSYSLGFPGGLQPYTPAWLGVNLVVQGAWNDSGNNQLKLSAASRNSLSAPPPFTAESQVAMKTAYGYDPNQPNAPYYSSGASFAIPIVRYWR